MNANEMNANAMKRKKSENLHFHLHTKCQLQYFVDLLWMELELVMVLEWVQNGCQKSFVFFQNPSHRFEVAASSRQKFDFAKQNFLVQGK
jgi:hypothetical protein